MTPIKLFGAPDKNGILQPHEMSITRNGEPIDLVQKVIFVAEVGKPARMVIEFLTAGIDVEMDESQVTFNTPKIEANDPLEEFRNFLLAKDGVVSIEELLKVS